MTPKEVYQLETEDYEPTQQIAYHEWFRRYVHWLEMRVQFYINKKV